MNEDFIYIASAINEKGNMMYSSSIPATSCTKQAEINQKLFHKQLDDLKIKYMGHCINARNLQNEINLSLKEAMKASDRVKTSVLRQLKTAIISFASSHGNVQDSVDNADILIIIRKLIKQREDSIAMFRQAFRQDLVDNEESEIPFLKEFLPAEMTEDEIDALIAEAIATVGAVSKKEMGKAIKEAQLLANGRVENKIISTKIGQLLK